MITRSTLLIGKVLGLILTSILLLAWSRPAYGYPDFVGKGYISCKSCHVTAHGGSPLSEYGRSASQELSLFGGPDLSLAGENYSFGASLRAIQLRRKFPNVTIDDYFLMQASPHGFVRANGITAGGRLREYFVEMGAVGLAASYRHSFPTFGLNIENHTTKTRRMWGREKDFVEVSIATNSSEIFVGCGVDFVFGKFVALFEQGRVGVSLHSDELYALSAIVKLFEGAAAMVEVNNKWVFGKVTWSPFDGLWVYGQMDHLTPGLGVKFMPLRHLTIDALVEPNRYWALAHVYF